MAGRNRKSGIRSASHRHQSVDKPAASVQPQSRTQRHDHPSPNPDQRLRSQIPPLRTTPPSRPRREIRDQPSRTSGRGTRAARAGRGSTSSAPTVHRRGTGSSLPATSQSANSRNFRRHHPGVDSRRTQVTPPTGTALRTKSRIAILLKSSRISSAGRLKPPFRSLKAARTQF